MPRVAGLKMQYMINDLPFELRKLRKKCKLSQRKLADKIGYETNSISRIETGYSLPGYEALIRWFDVCGATDEDVLRIMRGTHVL